MLAASIVSAGTVLFTPGCCSSCCGDACATSKSCSGAYGNWSLTLPYPDMSAAHLILEKDKDGKPKALLLWRWASPTPAEVTQIDDKSFIVQRSFSKPKGKANDKSAWRALRVECTVDGKSLKGTFYTVDGNGKAVDKPQEIVGKRNPPIGPAPDISKAIYGQPIDLLFGSMADFEIMGKDRLNGWKLKDGVLSNRIERDKRGRSTNRNGNLRTKRADFFDFKLSYDVRVLPGCNSGVYLRGIYEIQVLDSYRKPVDCHNMAALYGRITPRVAAEKPANEWQHVDVTLYKRHVTVVLNGVNIIDNQPILGCTGGAITSDEFVPGPLYIQGDHSDADFRNMKLTPIVK